ncbi:hypothetical protein VRU48_04760 [Pedobacter sp. KR3-3]|uniref:Uncharacterized protein n=1 Tax=Pedobacter albus TaxID=3113905 RepID=A0ABU7I4T6_9SPHI|nr:hypothetical protein [Pedobacter sp. KR3-3]MEE1944407.1 hypothetical protein [Pedobacter sp. KR3-3]
MKNITCLLASILLAIVVQAQELKLKPRKADALGGTAFAHSISDSTLSLVAREEIIFREIKNGNVPSFLRKFQKIVSKATIDNKDYELVFFVLPDYLAIGHNDDYFYMPMTPILAQKVANLLHCSLPTRKITDLIDQNATLKLTPQPIPPSKAMTTVPVFITHNDLVKQQMQPYLSQHANGALTVGNKKDIVISNKIYGETTPRVVIYGWHQLDGKPIQPLYNKHTNTWADYSHGVRLVQNTMWLNGKKTTLAKILADPLLSQLLSDEGIIEKSYYPVFDNY